MKELQATMASKLDAYEKILSKQKYLAGDVRALHSSHVQVFRTHLANQQTLTIADLFHLPWLYGLTEVRIPFERKT